MVGLATVHVVAPTHPDGSLNVFPPHVVDAETNFPTVHTMLCGVPSFPEMVNVTGFGGATSDGGGATSLGDEGVLFVLGLGLVVSVSELMD